MMTPIPSAGSRLAEIDISLSVSGRDYRIGIQKNWDPPDPDRDLDIGQL